MRRLWLVVLVACSHPAPPAAPPSNAAPKPVDYSATIADPYGFLPGDSDFVMRIDLRELRKSPVWNDFEPQILAAVFPDYASCGFDPLATVDSITAGIPTTAGTTEGVFVIRGLDREKTMHCLTQPGGRTKVTVDRLRTPCGSAARLGTAGACDGDVVTLANESGSVNLMTFVSPTVAVMVGSQHPTREELQHALASGAPLRQWPAFGALEAKLEPHAALAMLINGKSSLLAKIAATGISARLAYGTLRVGPARVEMDFHFAVADAQAASALAAEWDAQLHQARSMFERLAATSSGDTVTMSAAMTEPQLRTIISMVGGMFGQMKLTP